MSPLIQWLINTIAIIITSYLLPGVQVDNFFAALVTALVLGILNIFIKPILHFFALPITILTLGLFALVVNAGIIILVGWIVPGFMVATFWWALLFSIILSIINSMLNLMAAPIKN